MIKAKLFFCFLLASLLVVADYAGDGHDHETTLAGTWEGTKANGRNQHVQEPWGPIELVDKGHGTFAIVSKGSLLGDRDYSFGEAAADHGKIRVSRPGMTIEAELDHGQLKGYMEHHGMKETFTLTRSRLRSPEDLLKAFHHDPKRSPLPSHTEFLRVVLEKGLDAAGQLMAVAGERDHELFSAAAVNNLGYTMLNRGKTEQAITLFKLNVQAYPKDANSFDSLGEAYLTAGKRDAAIEALSKSLSLNPSDHVRQNTEKLLKELGVDPKSITAVN